MVMKIEIGKLEHISTFIHAHKSSNSFQPYFVVVFQYFSFQFILFQGYLEQGLLVRDAKKLRQHYFSTSHWRLDLVSMLPTDLAYLWWGPNECNFERVPCAVIVRINRLLRLPRMWEWFERTETATGYPNAFRICKVSVFGCLCVCGGGLVLCLMINVVN